MAHMLWNCKVEDGVTDAFPPRLASAVKSSRKSISSAHALHQRPPRTSSDWTQKLPLDMTCVLLAAVGITLLLVIWLVTVNQHPEVDFGTRERYCHTEECLRHAQLISTSLNDSVDPCEDFNAFVCSRLKPPCQCCEDSSYGSALATRALHGWFSDFREFLDAGKDHLRAGAKALAMFDACMAPTDREDAEAGKLMLRDVMTKLRIPWPDEPEPGVDPLGVLVMLTYRWHLDFWFNLTPRLMAAGVFETGSRTLMVRPGGFVAFWSVHDKEILRENGYVGYWNSFYEEFAADRPKRGKAYIEDVARVEQDVFDKLTRVINNENKEPAQFLLADIEMYSPSLPTDRWVKALRAAQTASDTMSFGHEPGDRFVVTDVALLKALDSLFATHSNVDLLRHLSWFFIQVFAALADRSLLKIKYRDHRHSAELHKHEFCATEVEDAYGPLVPVVYVYPRFTAAMRRSIDALFLELTQTAADMTSSLAWADGASRQVAMSKLLKVDTVLWPPESLLSNDTLSMLYANFSIKGFSSKRRLFIEYWIDAQQNLRALHENIAYRDVLVLPHNYVLPHMKYDYLQNWVVISVAALQGPLKAADSTPAMLYGGIGFLYARQMLRALDCGGLRIDAQGNVVPQSTECLQPVHEGPFPEIPALEVAYEAFQRKLHKGGDVPRRIMKKYDEQQVFFITACFTLCRLPNTLKSHGGDCNKAAMNFEPFAKAFKCKPDSAMNPSKKCPYFN
ncbi:endothelin-converting enzyme 1-like [Haemaphysalis longicornis]